MGAQGAPQLNVTPEQVAAFEQARSQINPEKFGTELLKEGEKIDPLELQSLKDSLRAANLPPEIIDAIGKMVDAVLAEPDKYAELRAGFLAEGVPEDLLPAEFDAGFFAALNLALDQLNTAITPESAQAQGLGSLPMGAATPPQAFAQGGIAQLKPLVAEMAKMGRYGDTMLAHITPAEARMLRRKGGSGTINPATGLPEFFLGGIFKAVGNAFKSVGKAIVSGVKAVVSGVKKFVSSSVGRVVTAVALGFFLGPAAAGLLGVTSAAGVAAVSGFIGGFGSSVLAGKNIGDSLKAGAIGGIGAGIGAGVMGGAEAFAAGSYAGPTTVAGQWDSLVSGAKNLVGAGTPTGAQTFPVPGEPGTPLNVSPTTIGTSVPSVEPPQVANLTAPPDTTGFTYTANAGASSAPSSVQTSTVSVPATPAPTAAPVIDTGGAMGAEPITAYGTSSSVGAAPGAPAPSGTTSFFEDVTTGAKNLFNKFVPSTPSDTELREIGMQAFRAEKAAGLPDFYAQRAFDQAVKDATPSILRKYGPLAAAGLGIMALTGGFKAPESEKPGLVPVETGFDLYKKYPERYSVNIPTPTTTYVPVSYDNIYSTPITRNMPTSYAPQQNVRRFADGGYAKEGEYPKDMNAYVPMDGPINGPGTGTSDSIPAMLSDGEFVFTAKAVRGAGNGSRRKGAKRMYALMKQLEEAN